MADKDSGALPHARGGQLVHELPHSAPQRQRLPLDVWPQELRNLSLQ